MAVHATLFFVVATLACAFHAGFDSLAGAREEAAQAMAAASEALARAKAAQQKVRDLGGADPVDSPFWFKDLFPLDGRRAYVYEKDPWISGPTPIDDLGILYAAIKELKPKTLVEVGFWAGDGTRALLSAADAGATVHSFDPTPHPGEADKLMAEASTLGRNFVFHEKAGEEITSEDFSGDKVGFAFIDTGHMPNMTKNCFEKLLPVLTDDAIVAIHDTGVWGKKFLDDHMDDKDVQSWWSMIEYGLSMEKVYNGIWPLAPHGEGDDQYYIHPNARQERLFVNMVMEAHPDWGIIEIGSLNHLSVGITIMQRQRKLDVAFP